MRRRARTRGAAAAWAAAACLAWAVPAGAGAPAPEARSALVIPRLQGPVKLDGLSDEPAWRGIQPLPYKMHQPQFGGPPTERTELLLACDDDHLYVAGRLYDSAPGLIQANSKQRDSTDASSDWWGVILDTFDDNENAVAFFTTPAGLRWDATVSNDAQGENPLNPSWNAFWDVAAVRTDEGWFAEMRIPFSSLRFQSRDGRVTLGVISWRQIARKNEVDIFPAVPPNWGPWSMFKPSQAQKAVLNGVAGHAPLYIAPYALAGMGRSYELDPVRPAYRSRETWAREAGLDVKYGLTSNLTLDLTVNTDFAQVEADDVQVNLTRFSLFLPEKRLFFQERESLFDFTFEETEQTRLFYSRRIGLEDGRSVPIYGGARLTGRLGAWDLGILDMQTAPSGSSASTNFGVLRLRRRVLNPYSYVGGMVASKTGADGNYNVAYGLDSQVRLFGEDYLTMKWAQTFSDGPGGRVLSLEPSRMLVRWQRRSLKGLGYGLSYSRAGAAYEPEMGFETRRDYARYAGQVSWAWLPGKSSPLFNHWFSVSATAYRRNADGSAESWEALPSWTFYAKSGWAGFAGARLSGEDIREPYALAPGVEVPAGPYRFAAAVLEVVTPTGRPFYSGFHAEAGTFYDGRLAVLAAQPVWHVSAGLELAGYVQLNRIAFPDRGQRFDSVLGRLKALLMLNTRLSVAAFVQYSGAADAVSANLRFRYNPREGVDLFLVYNEGLNTRRGGLVPSLPMSSGRTVMLKYTYTFNL